MIGGYVGALLTAAYAFRMIFRAFFGEPSPEARELEQGHLHHAHEPTNPATGEAEDTDVGFPGPDHQIAEREGTMKGAMGVLAVGATGLGFLQIPGVTEVVHHFLEPTFADSELYEELEPSVAASWLGLAIGAVIAIAGIAVAWRLWVAQPGTPARIRTRLAPLYTLPREQVVLRRADRPARRAAVRLARALRAQHVRARRGQRRLHGRLDRRGEGRLLGGAGDPVGLPALLRRPAAARPVRAGPLLPGGLVSLTIHLSIVLFWPLALAVLSATAPRRIAPWTTLVGSLVPLGYAIVLLFDFQHGRAGLQYLTDDDWIPELGIHYKLGLDGLNLWLVALTTLLFVAAALWVVFRPYSRPKLFAFHMGLAETAVLGAFLAQDLALFVLFFDLMLVPFAFLVLGWGGPDRVAATLRFVIYTLVGSLLMLAAAVATAVLTANETGDGLTFVLSDLARSPLGESTQRWIFVAFALAFLIKMPSFPLHGWMPDAYRSMPLPVLAVFSGILSKVAGLRLPEDRAARSCRRPRRTTSSCCCWSRSPRSSTARSRPSPRPTRG